MDEKEKAFLEHRSSKAELRVVWSKKGYILGFELAAFQVLTGIASYVVQTAHIISVSLQEPIFGLYTPILITVSQLIGTFISIPMLKHIEWKWLTVLGGISLGLWNALIALFFYLYNVIDEFKPYAMTLIMISLMAFMFTFGVTLGSSVWPYISYMLPNRALTAAQSFNWFIAGCAMVSFSVADYVQNNPYLIIWVFAGITLVLSIINAIFMVEVKDLSVRKVQVKLIQQ